MADTPVPDAEDVSRTAEDQHKTTGADPFPPEGTDESVIHPKGDRPLSETERVRATRAVIEGDVNDDQAAAPK